MAPPSPGAGHSWGAWHVRARALTGSTRAQRAASFIPIVNAAPPGAVQYMVCAVLQQLALRSRQDIALFPNMQAAEPGGQ